MKTIPFEPWPHLINLLNDFSKEKLVIILKARQLGISWLVCMYCVWKAKFHQNVKVLLLSQGEDEAFDLIAKCKFIDENFPDFLKSKRDPDQRGHIGFPDTGSEIVALASTEKAGRSTDATIVVCDEWEFHPYAEANFAALKPTIDAGGQFIGLSTADKTKMNTFFKQKYLEAQSGQSGFKPVFLSWQLRPGRTDEWFAEITRDYRPWQIEQEYPSTEKEALETLKSIPFFDPGVIETMYSDVREALKQDISDKHKTVKVYKLPQVGKKYCLFTDASEGREDPHALIIIDAMTGEEVASSHGKVTADYCSQIHDDLVRFYNDAFNAWEAGPGGAGGVVTNKLNDLETPNRCRPIDVQSRPFKLKQGDKGYGWWTSKRLKEVALSELEEAIRVRAISIHRRSCLDEFGRFMRPEGEEPQAPKGGHDDWIMAWAMVVQLKKFIPMGGIKIKSYTYRD